MIPWLIFAVVVVPLVVVGFAATRRRNAGYEHSSRDEAETEREFAEAEAYQEKWREEDKERYHQERLP